ncbi:FAD-dependent oxidoreductase, partial [Gordonibacter sp.]
AGLSLAGALSACAPKSASGESAGVGGNMTGASGDVKWTKEADVVVVGFGGAGAAAAIEAKKAGAEVIVLEMNEAGGGSTIANGGFIMMGGTDLQKKFGLEDSIENFYNYLSAAAGENANKEAIRLICDTSPELYRWCVECGMDFESGVADTVHHLGGYNAGTSLGYSGNEMAYDYRTVATPAPRGHMPQPSSSGKDMFLPLQKKVEELGIEVIYGTPGSYLLNDASGRITGIAGDGKDGEVFVKARKGVVLTCGGFVDNPDMLNAFYPYANKRGTALTTAGSEDGSGILMGMAVGAATQGMGCFQIGCTIVTNAEPLAKGVLVSEKGCRIVAEDEYNSFIGKAIIQAPTSNCYLIIGDAALKEAAGARLGEPVFSAGSVGEIAEKIGIDADTFKANIAFYNESVGLGVDREYGKDPRFLEVLEQGSLHVFKLGSESCYTASCGGLKIDLDAHVLDNDGKAIAGLYSAGRNAGTIYGWYMGSGSSMADVLTFGRIAGQKAAAEQV